MNDLFWLKLLLSFIVGGVWITLTTIAADRYGSRIGGLLGGVPSTIVVALLFIGWTSGLDRARATTDVFPLAFSFNAFYLIAFASLARYGGAVALGGAVATWLALQTVLALSPTPPFWLCMAIWFVVLVVAYFVLERGLKVRAQEGRKVPLTIRQVMLRGIFAGSVIALTVGLARVGGPLVGAIMGAFPAVYTTTLAIASQASGARFARGMTTSMMVSGLINVVVYALAFRLVSASLGLVASTLAAFGLSMITVALSFIFIKRRVS